MKNLNRREFLKYSAASAIGVPLLFWNRIDSADGSEIAQGEDVARYAADLGQKLYPSWEWFIAWDSDRGLRCDTHYIKARRLHRRDGMVVRKEGIIGAIPLEFEERLKMLPRHGWAETIKKNLALMIMHAPSVAPSTEYPQYRFDMLPYLEEVAIVPTRIKGNLLGVKMGITLGVFR
jgi:hypothetical protein